MLIVIKYEKWMIRWYIIISLYIYIPGTQTTLVLIGKGPLLEGSSPKRKDHFGGAMNLYISMTTRGGPDWLTKILGITLGWDVLISIFFCWWQFVIWKHIVLYNKLLVFMLLCRKQTILYKLLCNYLHVCLLLTILFFFFCSLLIRYSNLPQKNDFIRQNWGWPYHEPPFLCAKASVQLQHHWPIEKYPPEIPILQRIVGENQFPVAGIPFPTTRDWDGV